LSAKNSTANSAKLTTMTVHVLNNCSVGGRWTNPKCDNNPKVAIVAYRFSPAAKLVATSSAASSLAGSFTDSVYERGKAHGYSGEKLKVKRVAACDP
jgi:hypothetical protein